ncbi:hypothetical protein FVF58_10510 [Paraburkholderia panacisoli]|uniref:Uncharacterized protein n=1 Tax=Paraburkholderia panacisoli TaxID=2603818 RepID=A0A5B0HCZ2_9BURK|nr:hypothetical protein [Paraburkholderia panacisoli]KAA1013186.1 hypothetical protein FVF58_10510 [Paraburkholderia panacisoli]
MQRHLSQWRWVVILAACVIPVMHCAATARATDLYVEHGGAASAWANNAAHNSLQRAQPAVVFSGQTAAYFGDVPFTVVGVYGATMLDMLSGGPLVLVRWPNDCCSARQRWHTRRPMDNTPADPPGAHIFFLWPES